MNSTLHDALTKLRTTINELRGKQKSINEAQTKDWLIRPFFEALGWKFSDFKEVIPEDTDTVSGRCDYSFVVDGETKVLVEAKPLDNHLSDNKMITEKVNYCSNKNIKLLIITNGEKFKVYYSDLPGKSYEKLLFEFSVYDESDLGPILDMLTKESFRENKLLRYAMNEKKYNVVKSALERIFTSLDKPIVRLINAQIKDSLGHSYGIDDIKDALSSLKIVTVSKPINTENITPAKKQSKSYGTKTGKQVHEIQTSQVGNLYHQVLDDLRNNGLQFTIVPRRLYVNLVKNNKLFCSMRGQKNTLKVWIKPVYGLIPKKLLSKNIRSVENTGHWSSGKTECIINNIGDVENIVKLIILSYQSVCNFQ